MAWRANGAAAGRLPVAGWWCRPTNPRNDLIEGRNLAIALYEGAFYIEFNAREQGEKPMYDQSLSARAVPRWQGPELRWGARERAGVEVARERLLDAARFCYERLGIVSTSMADIAAQAKVTRPTVYRYFKNRQEVIHAVLRRELDQFWWRLEQELIAIDDFGEFLVEALLYVLCSGIGDGSEKLLFSLAARDYLRDLLAADAAPDNARHPVYAFARRSAGQPVKELLAAVEWFNRLVFSYLSWPPCEDAVRLRESLTGLCPWGHHFRQSPVGG